MTPDRGRSLVLMITFIAAFLLAGYAYARGTRLIGSAVATGIPEWRWEVGGYESGPGWFPDLYSPSWVSVPIAAVVIALAGRLGYEWGGLKTQSLLSLIALASSPLLFAPLYAWAYGILLALWCLFLILTARGSRRWLLGALGVLLLASCGCRWTVSLAAISDNVFALINPHDPAFPPWDLVRYALPPFYLLLGWGVTGSLALVGWLAVPAEQRRELTFFLVAPIVAGAFLTPGFLLRAFLFVPLAYLAARALLAIIQAELNWRGLAGVLVLVLFWSFHPDVSPRPRFWEGMGLTAMVREDWEMARIYTERGLDDDPRDGNAWGRLGYIHYRVGDPNRMNQALVRAALWSWRSDFPEQSERYLALKEQLTDRLKSQPPPQ